MSTKKPPSDTLPPETGFSLADLPDPLVPPEVDLSGLTYMPLDVQRLRDSDLVSEVSPAEFRAAVLLWCAAWHQVPAASLPNKEMTLARLAGFGQSELRAWRKVRDGALRGFVLCSDGRYYHPVVAEKALEAWVERREYQSAREGEAARKRRERLWRSAAAEVLRNNGIVPDYNASTSELRKLLGTLGCVVVVDDLGNVTVRCHGDASEDVTRTSGGHVTAKKRREEKRSGEERSGEERREGKSVNTARAQLDDNSAEAQLAAALRDTAAIQVEAADPEIARAASVGITPAELRAAAAGRPGKPVAWYVQRAIGKRADAATRSTTTPSPPPPPAPKDPGTLARERRLEEIDNEIIDVRHCAERGISGWTKEKAEERIAQLRQEMAALLEEVPA